MILVSCRKDFTSDHLFADEIEIRDYPNLANLNQFTELTQGELVERVRGKHVLVLVHGYRTPIKNVAAAYKVLEEGLQKEGLIGEPNYTEVIGFAWPSWRLRISFFAAVPAANGSSEYFYDLGKLIASSAKTLDVQTHSLGARVVLQALSAQTDLWVDNLILTAPAVDNESIEPAQEFNEAIDECGRCFVLHSKDDSVLKAYLFAQLDRALGKNGPEHPTIVLDQCLNVYVLDCHRVVKGDHSGYRKTPLYYEWWKRVLSNEPMPRFSALE